MRKACPACHQKYWLLNGMGKWSRCPHCNVELTLKKKPWRMVLKIQLLCLVFMVVAWGVAKAVFPETWDLIVLTLYFPVLIVGFYHIYDFEVGKEASDK